MFKITSVEPQKSSKGRSASGRNPKRFNIFIDGKFAFGADEDLVVDKRLIPGKEIEQEFMEKLLFEAEVGKLMERMYGFFNIRQRSEKEVRDKLRVISYELKIKGKEEISDLAVELVIKNLKQKNLLNDLEFAKAWVESRSKKKGPRVLKQELFQKGIDRETIEQIISGQWVYTESGEDYSEQLTAEKLLEKKLRIWKKLPEIEVKKKSFDFLLRRGFDYEIVKHTIDKFLQKR